MNGRTDSPPEAERVYRYVLTVEGDDYGLLSSLSEIAAAAIYRDEGKVSWIVRNDEEIRR